MSGNEAQAAVTEAHREEWARVVSALARRFGSLDVAEEAAAEAFAAAVARWPADGVPPNPGAWLTTTAKRKALDWIRRESKRGGKQQLAQMLSDGDPSEPVELIGDERLRLIFTCCHPALALEARVALALRLVAGLTMAEIAHAFLVQESTMGQRITRAKAKIRVARIPYRTPAAEDLPRRVSGVLEVLFLVFNEGYLATGPGQAQHRLGATGPQAGVAPKRDARRIGPAQSQPRPGSRAGARARNDPIRPGLTAAAIRLTRLVRSLMPEDGEVAGLLALMLLTEARRAARVAPNGELVPLGEQDRRAWDAALLAEGHQLVRERLAAGVAPGRYQILAAINAVHTSAPQPNETAWRKIVALYDQLLRLDPSPIVALNRAVAVAELEGPEVALAAIAPLQDALAGYHLYHATRAELLRRLGRNQQARAAYDRAIALAGNIAETAYLTRRRGQLLTPAAVSQQSQPPHGEHHVHVP
ncbi:MAG TPA: DUF6596 domain-containing protein [Terriglobales bacterium]|nr:DUF6596 domain-containing protein [Terriglobales bacterium]